MTVIALLSWFIMYESDEKGITKNTWGKLSTQLCPRSFSCCHIGNGPLLMMLLLLYFHLHQENCSAATWAWIPLECNAWSSNMKGTRHKVGLVRSATEEGGVITALYFYHFGAYLLKQLCFCPCLCRPVHSVHLFASLEKYSMNH